MLELFKEILLAAYEDAQKKVLEVDGVVDYGKLSDPMFLSVFMQYFEFKQEEIEAALKESGVSVDIEHKFQQLVIELRMLMEREMQKEGRRFTYEFFSGWYAELAEILESYIKKELLDKPR